MSRAVKMKRRSTSSAWRKAGAPPRARSSGCAVAGRTGAERGGTATRHPASVSSQRQAGARVLGQREEPGLGTSVGLSLGLDSRLSEAQHANWQEQAYE